MANRWFNQFRYSFLKYPVDLVAQVAIGAAGAPTLSAARSRGILSITRNAAGRYTVVLDDRYQRLLKLEHNVVIAAGTTSGVVELVVMVDSSNAAAKSVQFQFLDAAGVAADIANGAVLKLKFEMTNSTLD